MSPDKFVCFLGMLYHLADDSDKIKLNFSHLSVTIHNIEGIKLFNYQEILCSSIINTSNNEALVEYLQPYILENTPSYCFLGFNEISCHCGATVLYPPTPCGAKPPECKQLCARPHSCGHARKHILPKFKPFFFTV